jgi:hypothetical protein
MEDNRKKIIDQIIEQGNTWPENIRWYYVELQENNTQHHRDATYTYDDFVNKSIDEIRNMSHKSGGSKSPGYYRDPKDGKLKDRDGNLVQK